MTRLGVILGVLLVAVVWLLLVWHLSTPSVHVQPASLVVPHPTPTRVSRSRALLPLSEQREQRTLTVTSYCDHGRTASGAITRAGTAASNLFPFGTLVHVPDWGPVVVDDRSAPGATDLDLWTASCARARAWGRRRVVVEVGS